MMQLLAERHYPPPETPLEWALTYATLRWPVAPLCWPDSQGKCACPKHHTGNNIGKAPLTPHGIRDATTAYQSITDWWERWPNANIAIDIKGASLFIIAPDSKEWLDTFQKKGLDTPFIVQSGGGEGHYHFYFHKPPGCPVYRINKPGEYDIQTDGYVVAPPSLHQSGRIYQWLTQRP